MTSEWTSLGWAKHIIINLTQAWSGQLTISILLHKKSHFCLNIPPSLTELCHLGHGGYSDRHSAASRKHLQRPPSSVTINWHETVCTVIRRKRLLAWWLLDLQCHMHSVCLAIACILKEAIHRPDASWCMLPCLETIHNPLLAMSLVFIVMKAHPRLRLLLDKWLLVIYTNDCTNLSLTNLLQQPYKAAIGSIHTMWWHTKCDTHVYQCLQLLYAVTLMNISMHQI